MFDADELFAAATVFSGNCGLDEATAFADVVAVVPDVDTPILVDALRRIGEPRRDSGDKLWNSGSPLVGVGPDNGVAGAVAADVDAVTWDVRRGVPGAEDAGEEDPPPRKN